MINKLYLQIGELRKLEGFKISNYLKRFSIDDVNDYKKYCRNIRQQRFRKQNKEICNYRSRECMRKMRCV
jgi:hypothetical protein